MELLRLENVDKTYHLGKVDVPALRGISLSIHRGEIVALMGASGSGKSTLMNILGCLDRPSSGKYWLDGEEVSRFSRNQRALVRTDKIGFVFQDSHLLARTEAIANVLIPLEYALRRSSGTEARRLGEILLDRVGLADRGGHQPTQLSGGQQQRVAIARALVNRPRLLLADEPTGNLDSHASDEILRMFQQLNGEGLTIILVTHDPHVAAFAHRIIRIHDGRLDSDEAQTAPEKLALPSSLPPITNAQTPCRTGIVAKPRGWSTPPPLPATFRSAVHALRRNKLRSGLTALGVIIGVGAVIAMMEIGQGAKIALERTIASMGANNLIVEPGAASSGGVSSGAGTVLTLTPQDADAIRRHCTAVSEVAPMLWARAQAVYGNRNWVPMEIIGTTPSLFALRGWEDLDEGETFTEYDVRNGSKVCVIGQTLKRELFRDESPVGQQIRIRNVSFRVIGVLSRKGASMLGMDQDDVLLAPWTTIKYRVSGASPIHISQSGSPSNRGTNANQINTLDNLYPGSTSLYPVPSATQAADTPQPVRFANVETIHVKAASTDEIPQAIDEITDLLRDRHHIRPGQADDFSIRDMTESAKALTSTSHLMRALLLAVALISLVVGGVGIMNIMLVSVTERTREIGLRMAVGARSYHILRQFLMEALMLCLLGGAMGVVLGRAASMLIRSMLGWPTEPSLAAIVAALAVSAAVGIAFGLDPAWKASRLDPIEVLRYE